MLSYEFIKVEFDGPVAVLTLNRPEKRNALSEALRQELRDYLEHGSEGITATVITGEGPVFCAGMDLDEKIGKNEGQAQWSLFQHFFNSDKVFVAAVNGPVRGAGMTFVNFCDLAIADPSADFAMPQISHGFYSSVGNPLMQLMIPPKIAAQLVLTGLPITAERAAEIGLINMVSKPGKALATAKKLAERIAGFNPKTVATARKALKSIPYDAAQRQKAIESAHALNVLQFGEREDAVIDWTRPD